MLNKILKSEMLIFVLVALISCVNGKPDSDTLRLNLSLTFLGAERESLVSQSSDLEDTKLGNVCNFEWFYSSIHFWTHT